MIKINVTWPPVLAPNADAKAKKKHKVLTDWFGKCQAKINNINNQVNNGLDPGQIKVNEKLYKPDKVRDSYFLAVDGPFRGKCAYCECDLGDQHGDIEHYRPKGAVADEDLKPVKIKNKAGKTRDHWGYYWLAYDPMNLMPACIKCNQATRGGVGKLTRFPVKAGTTHASTHMHNLGAEKPLLINPLIEDPDQHFDIDLDTGIMSGKSDRGDACIRILNLNTRNRIAPKRRDAIVKIWGLFSDFPQNADKIKSIIDDGDEPYTFASRRALTWLREQFKKFDSIN